MHDIPESVRALGGIGDPHYADLFTLTADRVPERSAEEWARTALEDIAAWQGQFVWRVLLRLRLRLKWRGAATHVAGWRIAGRGDGWLRLEARSAWMTGNLLFRVEDDRLSLATLIRYDRPKAARVWSRLAPTHCEAVPGLLRQAYETGLRRLS
ncbi:hypothetical protein ACFPM3_06155 [Streptomyces coeruleoprunus]|uniref:DUF2867 domain-containing protein n=1 Tax=Streptomyces coeruleoprunus TaxID=285563 RepID=A0ABV9XCR8_9ACTN